MRFMGGETARHFFRTVPCAYSYGHTGLDTLELDNLDWSHDDDTPVRHDDDTPVRRGRPRDPPARHPPAAWQ